jgi:flagellar export protein FliJ
MAVFRFRAGAALDIRIREEREALSILAFAQARQRERELALSEASRVIDRARTDQLDAERRGIGHGQLIWHRNWIEGLAGAAEGARRELERARHSVHTAEQAWWKARRRRLALEKLRERAKRRFDHAERRAELQVIDELARVRYVAEIWRTES